MKFNKKVFSIFGGILVAMSLYALGANPEPLHYVLTVIDGICGQNVNFSGTVKFKGITTQAFSYENALTLDDAALLKHMHSNKTLLDTYTQSEDNLADAVSQKHGHTNKTLLDTYSQTNADLADSVSKKHAHSNSAVLAKFSEVDGKPKYDGQAIGGGEAAPVTLGTSGSQPIDFAVSKKYSITPTAAATFTTPNAADMDSVELAIVNGGTKITFPDEWDWKTAKPTLQTAGVDRIKLSAFTWNSAIKIKAELLWFYTIYDPYTKLLLNFNALPFVDSSSNNATISNSGTTCDADNKKFGAGALCILPGNGIYAPWITDYAFATGDFTVEFWVKTTSTAIQALQLGDANKTVWGLEMNWQSANHISTWSGHSATNIAVNDGNWHHVAWVRYGTISHIYIDGNSGVSWTDTTDYGSATNFGVVAYPEGSTPIYVDCVKISKGIARYTANFTPPISELIN